MSFALTARAAGGLRMTQWLIGMLAMAAHLADVDTVVNSAPQAYQVSTITVDTVTNSATYTVTIEGIDVSYTADGSAVNTEIVAGIIAAIEADPAVSMHVTAAATSSTVITLTGRTAGLAFTVTDADAKLTCATTTAADEADPIGFGRLLIDQGVDGDGSRLGALAASGSLTAQVDSWAITYEAVLINVEIIVDGVAYQVSHTMATDLDTSIDALVVKINGVAMGLPAATVIATANAGTATALVLTSEVAGKPFTSRVWLGVGATVAAPVLTQTAPISSNINRCALGISLHTYDEESTTAGVSTPSYPANAGVKTLRRGDVAVACSEVVTFGLPVYVELGVTADNGKFFVASSATRVRLDRAIWVRDEQSGAEDEVAILRLA